MANIKRANASGITKPGTAIADVPDAPTIGTATGGQASATVTYTAATTGGTATTFTATSSPGSITGTGASPITISGLTNGTAYSFTVTASNSTGTSPASSASNQVTPISLGDMDPIAMVEVGSAGASTITFSSIPSTYKNLQVRITTTATASDDIGMKVNSNVGLKTHWIMGDGSTAVSTVNNPWSTYGLYISNNGNVATNPTSLIIDLLDYTSTSKNKVIRFLGGRDANGTGRVWLGSGLFDDLTAVSTITFTSSFAQYTSAALYGIKGA